MTPIDLTDPVTIYACPGGCPPGQCDTKGPGQDGRFSCAHCAGTGIYDETFTLAERFKATTPGDKCPYCKGSGLGGGYSTASCSKCGQTAMSRSLWEGP
jgi:hypothetical protein